MARGFLLWRISYICRCPISFTHPDIHGLFAGPQLRPSIYFAEGNARVVRGHCAHRRRLSCVSLRPPSPRWRRIRRGSPVSRSRCSRSRRPPGTVDGHHLDQGGRLPARDQRHLRRERLPAGPLPSGDRHIGPSGPSARGPRRHLPRRARDPADERLPGRVVFRPKRLVLGMGIDSVAVLILYALGTAGLFLVATR